MAATEEAKETKEVQGNITDTQVVRATKYIEETNKQTTSKQISSKLGEYEPRAEYIVSENMATPMIICDTQTFTSNES